MVEKHSRIRAFVEILQMSFEFQSQPFFSLKFSFIVILPLKVRILFLFVTFSKNFMFRMRQSLNFFLFHPHDTFPMFRLN